MDRYRAQNAGPGGRHFPDSFRYCRSIMDSTPHDPTLAARRLLSDCMNRALERLQIKRNSTPEDVKDLMTRSSEGDRRLLQDMYKRTALVALGSSAAALIFTTVTFKRSVMGAVVGGVSSGIFGAGAAAVDIANNMPQAMLGVVSHVEPSAMADELICPSVLEFEPCARDARCRDLMYAGERTGLLIQCLDACRSRSAHYRATASASVAMGVDAAAANEEVSDHGTMTNVSEPNGAPHTFGVLQDEPHDPHPHPHAPHRHTRSTNTGRERVSQASSWEAVRARHRAAEAASHAQVPDETLESSSGAPAPIFEPGLTQPARQPQQPRRKTNAYGDDVME